MAGSRWLFSLGALMVVAMIAVACGDDDDGADTISGRIGSVEFRGEVTSGITDNTLTVTVEEVKEGGADALRQLLDCPSVKVDISNAELELEDGLPQDGDTVDVTGDLLASCIVDAEELEVK